MPHGHAVVPEPIMVDHFRSMISFQLMSGLPEDRIVNTFHFRNDGALTPGIAAANANEAVREFFFDAVAPATVPIVGYLNFAQITGAEIVGYDLGQAPPRAPISPLTVSSTDLAKASTAGGPPFEVAACVSWRTNVIAPKTGTAGKTGRGRNYLGPLTVASSTGGGEPTLGGGISVAFRDAIKAAALRLFQNTTMTLVVLSKKYAQADEVVGGWVDNAPDIQRRRGPQATARTVF